MRAAISYSFPRLYFEAQSLSLSSSSSTTNIAYFAVHTMKQFLYGILGALSVISCHANSNTAQQPLQLIKYGAFIKTAVYSIAQEYGLFTAYGVNVTYLQVPNSTYSNDQLASGGYDVLLTAIDNVANNRWNLGRNFTALAQTDGGADIVLAGIPSITNILQLKGKNLMVDSPISGFAYLLRKILAVNGLHLENGDYSFIVSDDSAEKQ